MNREQAQRAADGIPDEKLTRYQLHCRYAIRWGADMQEAADIWRRMKGRYEERIDHLAALRIEMETRVLPEDRTAGGIPQESRIFRHSQVFPIIARLIIDLSGDNAEYVTHGRLVEAMEEDEEAVHVIRQAGRSTEFTGKREIVSNMVAWFSQKVTAGTSEWEHLFDRRREGGVWSYRNRYTEQPDWPVSNVETSSSIEGARYVIHRSKERSRRLAVLKRAHVLGTEGRIACEVCGFETQRTYPGMSGDICEIHHRVPLAECREAVETRLQDLAILCANCHRAIHNYDPLPDVGEFRQRVMAGKATGSPAHGTH